MTEDELQELRRARLIELVERLGGAASIGRAKGLKRTWESQYAQIKSGGSFGSRAARNLEEKLKLPAMYFDTDAQTWDGSPADTATVLSFPASDKQSTDVVIRQWETGGAMGHGLVLHDQPGIIKEWTVSADWLQQNVHRVTSHKNLAIVTGFGPSMQPVFNPGDPLLVDCGVKRADSDGVYFFRVGEEGFVKQLQRIPTVEGLIYRAKSYNPQYDPFEIVPGMDFEVFGRVVKVWKGEEF